VERERGRWGERELARERERVSKRERERERVSEGEGGRERELAREKERERELARERDVNELKWPQKIYLNPILKCNNS